MLLHNRYSLILCLLLLPACGASAGQDVDANSNLDAGKSDDAIVDAIEDAATPDAEADGALRDARELDEPFEYPDLDSRCRDASLPADPPSFECDPLAQSRDSGCGFGEACVPVTLRPDVECKQSTHGTRCFEAGSGRQGSDCGAFQGCASGFICLSSEFGILCSKLCEVDRIGACEDGLVCFPIDGIPSYGGCL